MDMKSAIYAKIAGLRDRLAEVDMSLGAPATPIDIETLIGAAWYELSAEVPSGYLDFLRNFDGFIAGGVFLYTSSLLTTDDEIIGNGFVGNNVFQRNMEFMENFLVFGESDMDVYVLDLASGRYQVRDRVAIDNVFEEFDTFEGLLEYMVDLVALRFEGLN
ncbi:YrhA family protein [Pseudomonas plecoglossicida]|uniref:YrhA family protein n=1 Tax=Pseudomonas plecoglossicida TaxID=70775 RepID=UPI0012DD6EE6|nr:YrhA family protein [Pseudomonas plecoglossicida]GLR37139.1 hypothetical protein GCM10011247_25360 [Pseudomonas plecoglossicida]